MTRGLPALVLAAGAAGSLGATCDDAAGAGPPIVTVTAPFGLGQEVPTRTLAFGWTVTGAFDPAATRVVMTARSGGAAFPVVDHGAVGDGSTGPTSTGFTWGGMDIAGHPVPPGFYDFTVDVGAGPVDAGDTHAVVVQGVGFTAPAAGSAPITVSAAAPVELDLVTSTVSTLDVALYARPVTGAAISIKDVPVPGEVRSVSRTITWGGADDTGAPLPSGTYHLGATVTDSAASVTYAVAGGDAIVR